MQVWQRASDLAKKHEYERAYKLILQSKDDLFLLRLVMQTGPAIMKHLDLQLARQVLARVNDFVRGGIFEELEVELIDDFRRAGHLSEVDTSSQNEYLDTLY